MLGPSSTTPGGRGHLLGPLESTVGLVAVRFPTNHARAGLPRSRTGAYQRIRGLIPLKPFLEGHLSGRGRPGAMGPSCVQLYAAICRSLQSSRRKYAEFLTARASSQSAGRRFESARRLPASGFESGNWRRAGTTPGFARASLDSNATAVGPPPAVPYPRQGHRRTSLSGAIRKKIPHEQPLEFVHERLVV
jgi:hypothetical protein